MRADGRDLPLEQEVSLHSYSRAHANKVFHDVRSDAWYHVVQIVECDLCLV